MAAPLNSWTRTLNLDDTHWMLATATVGDSVLAWEQSVIAGLGQMSRARQRELIRILRATFLTLDDHKRIANDDFLAAYHSAPASAQIDLVDCQWALSHPLTLLACRHIIAPALESAAHPIALQTIDDLVTRRVKTSSEESLRKSRTVLLGALQGVGVVQASGTGKHRTIRASRGTPHPLCFAYLLRRDLNRRQEQSMMAIEAIESSLPCELTLCGAEHAQLCVDWCVNAGTLWAKNDEVGIPDRG